MVGCSHRLSKSEEPPSWVLFSSRAEKWQMVAFIKCARTETVTKEVESERRALQVVFPYVFKSFRNSSWHKIYQTTLTIISFTFRTVVERKREKSLFILAQKSISIYAASSFPPPHSISVGLIKPSWEEKLLHQQNSLARYYRNWLNYFKIQLMLIIELYCWTLDDNSSCN